MTELRFPALDASHPLNLAPADTFKGQSFAPKLTFADRCAILGFYKTGFSLPQIAAGFKVNRRTVNKVISELSNKYKDVRDEYRRLGEEAFIARYVTPEWAEKVMAAKNDPEVELVGRDYDAAAPERGNSANKRATGQKGISTIKEDRHDFSHRIEVEWLEADTATDIEGRAFEHPAGWYWRDLDGEHPTVWNGDPENGYHLSSARALQHARENA